MRDRAFWKYAAAVAIGAASLLAAGDAGAQRATGQGDDGRLLLLVTETVERPGGGGETTRYWWQNSSDPNWTETDRVLMSALRGGPAQIIESTRGQRISNIYRRPELSLDNASSLASLLEARRLVVGQVHYEYSAAEQLPGLRAVHVDATLQLVDVASSEPNVLRSFETRRSLFGGDSFESLGERARDAVGARAAGLLGRILTAASGPVGLEGPEPVLAFHDLEQGVAVDRIRKFVRELDEVDRFRIRWASEGLIAFTVNPGAETSAERLEYVAKALEEHPFDGMALTRRDGPEAAAGFEFDVEFTEDVQRRGAEREGERGAN